MINQLKGIQIKGGYFEDYQLLPFFSNNSRVSLIFGKNGSGKSTICNAFYNVFNEKEEADKFELSLTTDSGNFIQDGEKFDVEVYGEEFVDSNVKYKSKGLKSVVMFGTQVDIDAELKKIEEAKTNIEAQLSPISEKINELNKPNNESSHLYKFRVLKENLQSDDGWAKRDMKIRGNSVASRVTENNISIIFTSKNNESNMSLTQLSNKFNADLDTYQLLKRSNSKKKENLNLDFLSPSILDKTLELLYTVMPKRKDQSEIGWLFDELENRGHKFYEDVVNTMEDKKSCICPFCMQELTLAVKKNALLLVNELQTTENKDVVNKIDNKINVLESRKIATFDLEEFKDIRHIYTSIKEINTEIKSYNDILDVWIKKLEEKKESLYIVLDIEKYDFAGVQKNIASLLSKINEEITNYNEKLADLEKVREDLIQTNSELVSLEYSAVFEDYKKTLAQYHKELDTQKDYSEKLAALIESENSLKAKKANEKIALDEINKKLEYIFFEKDRIKLTLDREGDYNVKARGKDVKLKNLSVGERNIISLCYYFTKLYENCEENNKYDKPRLIIVDDPISSLDFNNKIGIYSFMRKEFKEILLGNKESKIILFSHDFQSMIQFSKMFDDIGEFCKSSQIYGGSELGRLKATRHQLRAKKLETINFEKFHQMSRLVTFIAEYAYDNEEEVFLDDSIGNTLRKVLEGYGAFNYNATITELSNKKEILEKIEDVHKREYYSNLMYRFLLHDESHMRDTAQASPFNNIVGLIDSDEKRKVAKDVLSFLYELDSLFVRSNLKCNGSARKEMLMTKIKEHSENILNRVSVG